MPKPTTNRPDSARRSRTDLRTGGQFQTRLPAPGFPGRSRRRRETDSTPGNDHAYLLNPSLKPIVLHIIRDGSFFDQDEWPQDRIREVISMLYHVLFYSDGFKDTKKWESLPTLPELADYLVSELHKIHDDSYHFGFDDEKVLRFYSYREISSISQSYVL